MKNYEFQTKNLANEIRKSNEYNHYHRVSKKIMQDEELFAKICEFRRKKLEYQLENYENAFEQIGTLRIEYETVLNNSLVTEFLMAEQRLAKMGREIVTEVLDSLDLNIDFLDY